jgi:hypothetical protein
VVVVDAVEHPVQPCAEPAVGLEWNTTRCSQYSVRVQTRSHRAASPRQVHRAGARDPERGQQGDRGQVDRDRDGGCTRVKQVQQRGMDIGGESFRTSVRRMVRKLTERAAAPRWGYPANSRS